MRRKKMCAAVLLSCVLAVTLASCGGKTSDSSNDGGNAERYDVSKKEMESTESSAPEETQTASSTEPTSEGTTETTSTDASRQDGSSGKQNGKNSQKTSRSGDGTTEEEYYEDPDTPTEVFTPDIEIYGEKNIADDIALCNVTVNGKELSLTDETVDTFIKKAGIKQNLKCSFLNPFEKDNAYDGIFWYGKGYGIYSNTQDEAKRFTGTQVFIEGLDIASVAGELDPTAEGVYRIRSVYSSVGATKKDFTVSYIGGVKVGMSKTDIESRLGKGGTTKTYTYYANKLGALLIRYGEDDTAAEIYLYADYEDVPIKYLEAENVSSEETETATPTDAATEETTFIKGDTPPDAPPDSTPPANPPKKVN